MGKHFADVDRKKKSNPSKIPEKLGLRGFIAKKGYKYKPELNKFT